MRRRTLLTSHFVLLPSSFLLLTSLVCLAACSRSGSREPAPAADDLIALNNRGVGLMGQYDFAQARDLFMGLAAAHPERLDLQVNLAIATLNRQQEGDDARAQETFRRVLAADSKQLRAHYGLGLVLLNDGHASDALPHFTFVTEQDPGDSFFDYDLDRRLDLLTANGHIEDENNKVQASQRYLQPPHGDLDVVLTTVTGAPRLLRNDQRSGHHWVRLVLTGAHANRDAIGSVIEVRVGGETLRRAVMPTRGYLSQSELPATIGLGDRAKVDEVRILWPDGSVQVVHDVAVDYQRGSSSPNGE